MLFKKTIGIDLGTDTTQIYLNGAGIVVNEPSIVTYNTKTSRVISVGEDSKKMISRTPAHVLVERPITHGVIADFDMAREMVTRFLKKKQIPWSWTTKVVTGIPTNLTEVERKSVEDLLKEVGAGSVFLVEQPLAAALGSRLEVSKPTAYLIIDIGAGTTDMAVISLNGVVTSRRIKIGGNYLNNEIIKGIREELKLSVGEPTAEDVKIVAGSAVSLGEKLEATVRGMDISSGLPKEILIKDTQVKSWINQSLKTINETIKDLIENTPSELVGDVYKNGVYLVGGGGLLRGIDQFIQKEVGVEAHIVDDPLSCVARGLGVVAENLKEYKHILNNFSTLAHEE